MLWLMLSIPGTELSPLARATWMSWRAISDRVQPRSSRCRRSQEPSVVEGARPSDITRNCNDWRFDRSTVCPALPVNVGAWLAGGRLGQVQECGDEAGGAGAGGGFLAD